MPEKVAKITNNKEKSTTYDVVVIGGGPAGMMAAGRAGELGAKVLLVEKNSHLGKKLLITGGGRCNVTNAEYDTRTLLKKYGESDKFLFSPFSQFGVKETLELFEKKGLEVKVENLKRVFPVSNKSESVLNALKKYIKEGGVEVLLSSEVASIVTDGEKIKEIVLKDKTKIKGANFILSTGGLSRPETGSTGDGFKWLSKIGHSVKTPTPSLVPIETKEAWSKKLQGTSLPNVKVSVFQNNTAQLVNKGKILFTHFGLSGPLILNMSKDIGEMVKYGETIIALDLFPSLDHGSLDKKILKIFEENQNKKFKNALPEFLPTAVLNAVLEVGKFDKEIFAHSLNKDERKRFVYLLKDLRLSVVNLLGEEKAIITSGGVALTEIDFKTMKSKKYSNLFVVGDILDIDRPSGGYSLQLCWTTGFIAGENASKNK